MMKNVSVRKSVKTLNKEDVNDTFNISDSIHTFVFEFQTVC